MLYWGSEGVTEPGSRNLMGMNSPAAEAMIDDHPERAKPRRFHRRHPRAGPGPDHGALCDPDLSVERSRRIAHVKELHYPGQSADLRRLDRLAARCLVVGGIRHAQDLHTCPDAVRACGCETVEGVGQDISNAGRAMKRTF